MNKKEQKKHIVEIMHKDEELGMYDAYSGLPSVKSYEIKNMEKTAMKQMVDYLQDLMDKTTDESESYMLTAIWVNALLLMKREKEQIVNAVYDSMGTNFDPNMGRAELYYNEKFSK